MSAYVFDWPIETTIDLATDDVGRDLIRYKQHLQDVQQNLIGQLDTHFVQVAADYDRVVTNLETPLLHFMAKSANHLGRIIGRMLDTVDGELGVIRVNLDRIEKSIDEHRCNGNGIQENCPVCYDEKDLKVIAQSLAEMLNGTIVQISEPVSESSNGIADSLIVIDGKPRGGLPRLPDAMEYHQIIAAPDPSLPSRYVIRVRVCKPQEKPVGPGRPVPAIPPRGLPPGQPLQPMAPPSQPQPITPTGFPIPYTPPQVPPSPQPQPKPEETTPYSVPPTDTSGGTVTPQPTGQVPCPQICPPPQVNIAVTCPTSAAGSETPTGVPEAEGPKGSDTDTKKKDGDEPECPVTMQKAGKWEPKVQFSITSLPLSEDEPCQELFPLGSDFWRGVYHFCKQHDCTLKEILDYTPPPGGGRMEE